jgi:hypothetical protein
MDVVVILARTIVLVPMHALARMLVPAKTPVLALTIAYRKFLNECRAVVRSVDQVTLYFSTVSILAVHARPSHPRLYSTLLR